MITMKNNRNKNWQHHVTELIMVYRENKLNNTNEKRKIRKKRLPFDLRYTPNKEQVELKFSQDKNINLTETHSFISLVNQKNHHTRTLLIF